MILILGGTGRIGSSLVRQLRKQTLAVRVMARDVAAAQAALGKGVEVVFGDLDRPDTLAAAFDGIGALFLLTAQSPRQAAQELAAIAAAKAAGAYQVVKLSAGQAVVGEDSPTAVGRAHAVSEAALKASGLAWTILRPGAFMQTLLGPALAEARRTGRLMLPLGCAKVAFVDIDDVARAAASALARPEQARTLTITGPESLGVAELAAVASADLGRPVKAVSPPRWLARLVLGRRIADPFLRRHQLAMLDLMRAGALAAVSSDLEHATGRPGRSVADWLTAQRSRP